MPSSQLFLAGASPLLVGIIAALFIAALLAVIKRMRKPASSDADIAVAIAAALKFPPVRDDNAIALAIMAALKFPPARDDNAVALAIAAAIKFPPTADPNAIALAIAAAARR